MGQMGEDADARLCAVVSLAQAMAAAQTSSPAPTVAGGPPHRDVAHAAALGASEAMGADFAAISFWERDRGRLRVLVNVGARTSDEEEFPEDESYPVHDFPEITEFLHEEWAGGGPAHAWLETTGESPEDASADPGSGGAGSASAPYGTAAPYRTAAPYSRQRVAALRRRGRGSCVVAPIVLHGRAWGELYVARVAGRADFDQGDARFATVLASITAAGIAQNERLEEVRRLAFTDPLTGLANRRALDSRLDEALDLHRDLGTVVSLVVCDINGLKRVNDEHGHQTGDRLLERFAGILSFCGALLPGALAGRLGGDEFCLLAIGPTADEVVRAADELCRRAAELDLGDGVACGVASTGDPIGEIRSARALFRLADAAQYRAKALRSQKPVVAAREGGADDPTLRLAATTTPHPPERRRFRRT